MTAYPAERCPARSRKADAINILIVTLRLLSRNAKIAWPNAEVIESPAIKVYAAAMRDWTECPAVERKADRVGGAWVFRGTRVPVRALVENLEDGASVDDFLEWFPGVQRNQIEAVLEHIGASLGIPARA